MKIGPQIPNAQPAGVTSTWIQNEPKCYDQQMLKVCLADEPEDEPTRQALNLATWL
jgi:hypothetical protein